jgi:hypothetical protein
MDEFDHVSLVVGNNNFDDYDKFKKIITLVPWEVSWIMTNQITCGVGRLSKLYAEEKYIPISVYSGDPNIKTKKKRRKQRNKYYFDGSIGAAVIIWDQKNTGGLLNIINKSKKLFLPLFIYNINTNKFFCLSPDKQKELKEKQIKKLKQIEKNNAQNKEILTVLQAKNFDLVKKIKILNAISHIRKTKNFNISELNSLIQKIS